MMLPMFTNPGRLEKWRYRDYHCAKGASSPCSVHAAADAVQAAPTTQRSDRMRSGPRVRQAFATTSVTYRATRPR